MFSEHKLHGRLAVPQRHQARVPLLGFCPFCSFCRNAFPHTFARLTPIPYSSEDLNTTSSERPPLDPYAK